MKRCKVNCVQLQDNLIAENLMGKHASRPYNPNIADVFYLAGFIESWGRCIEKYVKHVNQMILPTATNEGLTYMNANANTIAQTRKNQITSNVLNAVNTATSAIATGGLSLIGGGVSNVISGVNTVKEIDARNKDTMLTPSTISSFGIGIYP